MKIMEEHGWTQLDLAHELGVSQSWISEVSRGRKDTGMAKAIALLARVGWEVRISPKAEDPVKRREFLTAAASVIFLPSARTNPYQDPQYVGTLTATMARNRYELGGIPLASSALGHMQRMEHVLAGGGDRLLQAASSRLVEQVTLVLYDAGRLPQAERAGRVTLDLATRAEDHEGRARAYETLSRVVLEAGDHARSVAYAQQGLKVPELGTEQRATLHMRLGRALASVPGNETASRDALDRALNTGALSPFGEAALLGDVAIGLGALRVYREAADMLDTAAEAIGQWSPLFRAQFLGRQVLTALRASDASLASERMHELARALPFVASARVNKRAEEILRASFDWQKVPELRQAREHVGAMLVPGNQT
ncbi:tetratricopeptide repeat protein [Sphaerisporangium rubeum]|uniref:Transcriptional regulator with XRE-family HTH domain n=1 Tax=Sphaerisporangium rubeum TaxID=321317 RepID=A0A7X0IKR9_9ACTN|nr:tetratricopeptide repeat protein [Sphaerisporangium rubeum]MBB6476559.1 transcriptional regulator with XRE-family HTH domain [Sphaerisporangium rubeum]